MEDRKKTTGASWHMADVRPYKGLVESLTALRDALRGEADRLARELDSAGDGQDGDGPGNP